MSKISQLALFGSVARGAQDSFSDLDIIAVVDSAEGVDRKRLEKQLKIRFGRDIGLSIYGVKRLRSMWREGSPFAWHLYLESRPLDGYKGSFKESWGAPAPYISAREDCLAMCEIIDSAERRISENKPWRDCYEAGLLFTGSRNVAMFASNRLLGAFNFSRDAPLAFEGKVKFPIDHRSYSILARARHATTRGMRAPELDRKMLLIWAQHVRCWARSVVNCLG